jgi:hypothetical protein
MAMAYADDGMTTIKVQIFLALVVPHFAVLALHNVHIEKGINIK